MKKITIICFLVLSTYSSNAQCQLCYLTASQKDKATEYLNIVKEVILYSACENNDIARKLKISKVIVKPADTKGFFRLILKGEIIATFDIINQKPINYIKTNTIEFEGAVDLAYLHIRSGGYIDDSGNQVWDATCLGIFLGFDCNPCIDPFDYPYEAKK